MNEDGTGTARNTRSIVTPTSLSASPTSASANVSCYTSGKRADLLYRLELQVGKETRFYHRWGAACDAPSAAALSSVLPCFLYSLFCGSRVNLQLVLMFMYTAPA